MPHDLDQDIVWSEASQPDHTQNMEEVCAHICIMQSKKHVRKEHGSNSLDAMHTFCLMPLWLVPSLSFLVRSAVYLIDVIARHPEFMVTTRTDVANTFLQVSCSTSDNMHVNDVPWNRLWGCVPLNWQDTFVSPMRIFAQVSANYK